MTAALPFNPNSEGFFCARCQLHRTRSVAGLCPTCEDVDKHPERAAREKTS